MALSCLHEALAGCRLSLWQSLGALAVMLCPICGNEARQLPLRLCKCTRPLVAHLACLADFLALQDHHSGSARLSCFFCRTPIRLSLHRGSAAGLGRSAVHNERNFWLLAHLNLFSLALCAFLVLLLCRLPPGLPHVAPAVWLAVHRLLLVLLSALLLATAASYIRVVDGEWKKMGCNPCGPDGPFFWRLHAADGSGWLPLAPSDLTPREMAGVDPRSFPLITRAPHLFLVVRSAPCNL